MYVETANLVRTSTGGAAASVARGLIFATPVPFRLSATANITAGAATATTAQLTAPAGKTTANFQAGKISDDTRNLPGLDLASNTYTELEWSVIPDAALVANGEQYEFAVFVGERPLDAYTVTPKWTIGTAPAGGPYPFYTDSSALAGGTQTLGL